jgi:protoporphyrinogen oxidase
VDGIDIDKYESRANRMTAGKNIIIIGAGPAGLAAALELTRNGFKPVIIEKTAAVGGMARTEKHGNFLFDIGGHRFFTRDENIRRLWNDVLGKDFSSVNRLSRIFYQDRLINYPLSFFNVLYHLGFVESILILSSYLKTKFDGKKEENTFEQWIRGRFGERLYRKFFKPYTEKVWGLPCDQIRSDWAAQRIKGLSLTEALYDALFNSRKADSLISRFQYPLMGSGMMWQALLERVTTAGGDILFNAEAVDLKIEKGRIQSLTMKRGDVLESSAVDHLISSMPINHLVKLLGPQAPPDVSDAARALSYRNFIMVLLIVARRHIFPDQWIYLHGSTVKAGRIQNFKNWSSALVPDPEKTSVGMEYFCNADEEIWHLPDSDLIALAGEELVRLGFAKSSEIVDACVVRQPQAYPIYDSGYRERINGIKYYLESIDNLQTIGRGGTYRYSNMDQAMQSGIMAAQNMMGAAHPLWDGGTTDEYLEAEEKTNIKRRETRVLLRQTFTLMDQTAFGAATGLTAGLLIWFITVWPIIRGDSIITPYLGLISNYFLGYTVTFGGALIGFGYGFIWGFCFGWIFGFLRNAFIRFYIHRLRKKIEAVAIRNIMDRALTFLEVQEEYVCKKNQR